MTERVEEMEVGGRPLTTGSGVRVRGERGAFRFICLVLDERGNSVLLYGGTPGHERWRSVRPEVLEPAKKKRRR